MLFGEVIGRSSAVGGSMSQETLRVQSLTLLVSFLLSALYIFSFLNFSCSLS